MLFSRGATNEGASCQSVDAMAVSHPGVVGLDPACGGNFRHANWGLSWATALLPYIDQAPAWNQYDSSLPCADNPQVTSIQLAIFKCPSDPYNKQIAQSTSSGATPSDGPVTGVTAVYSKGNIAANYGGGFANENTSDNGDINETAVVT